MLKNIRNETDRAALVSNGFVWATVLPRGDNKGAVRSAHKTYAAAEKAAKGKERTIVDVRDAASF